MMNKGWNRWVMVWGICGSLCGGMNAAAERVLTAESVLIAPAVPDLKDVYDDIEGSTYEEKNQHAMSTLAMSAVGAMGLYVRETVMNEEAVTLLGTLDAEGAQTMLKAHKAWREYINLQADFMTDPGRGGSARGLYWKSILDKEMRLRTSLYQDMAEGKNVYKENLYIYTD